MELGLPEHLWEEDPVRDDFDSTKLGLNWNFVRNPYKKDWSLTDRPGYLRLNGSAVSMKDKDSPAYICRRQTAFDISASTSVDFKPESSNQEAGLVIRGDDNNHYDLLITLRDGKRNVMFREVLKGKEVKTVYKEIVDGEVVLRISATALEYKFWLQQQGKPEMQIASAPTKNLATEVISGFTGVFIGMYASGNGSANTNPADFAWFDYSIEK